MTTKTKHKASTPDITGLEEIHCSIPDCDKFLGYGNIRNGLVNIKCHRCKASNLKFNFSADMPDGLIATEVRCSHCDRFLYLSAITDGKFVVKCRICKEWHILEVPILTNHKNR